MDDLPQLECQDCGLVHSVIFNNDALGQWSDGYCPRCGENDVRLLGELPDE